MDRAVHKGNLVPACSRPSWTAASEAGLLDTERQQPGHRRQQAAQWPALWFSLALPSPPSPRRGSPLSGRLPGQQACLAPRLPLCGVLRRAGLSISGSPTPRFRSGIVIPYGRLVAEPERGVSVPTLCSSSSGSCVSVRPGALAKGFREGCSLGAICWEEPHPTRRPAPASPALDLGQARPPEFGEWISGSCTCCICEFHTLLI